MIVGDRASNPNYLPMVAGRYYFVPNATSPSTNVPPQGQLRGHVHYIPNRIEITKIGAEVTSAGEAGSVVRLGIYADDNGRPGALVLDAGTINGTSVGVQEITISTTIGPGWYWFAECAQLCPTTPPTMRTVTSFAPPMDVGTSTPAANATQASYRRDNITGALPNPFASAPTVTSTAIRIFIKT